MTRAGTMLLVAVAWLVAAPASAQDTTAPTAVLDAPNSVAIGASLTLSGSRSTDVGGRIARYVWTRIEGTGGGMALNMPFGTLESSLVVPQTAGNPLAIGRHRFRLIVEDNSGNRSQPVERVVFILDSFPPTAVLEVPSQIIHGRPFTLSAAGSTDVGGRVVRYQWTRVGGSGGGPMPLNEPVVTETASYTVQQSAAKSLAGGKHVFRLIVMDDSGNQSQPADDSAVVLVPDTTAPTAVLDVPNSLAIGSALQLSGAQSTDIGGRVVRYVWTRLEGNGGGMPLNQPVVTEANVYLVPQPAGNALAIGRHRFRLAVTDDSGNQSQPVDRVVIVLDNIAPTAVLDAPRTAMQIQPFQLSAARSFDTGGRVVRYQWVRIAGSGEGPIPLNTPFVTEASGMTIPQSLTSYLGVGRHIFRLVVTDDSGNQSNPTDVAVDITAPLPSGRSQ